ncbi:uncharacterized protein LOC123504596 isoform X3 [Portunus trituberculatus]|nr:uncharacterized protein LOC123504596 isoform X3 [Portunus trituberculatus]
MRFFYISYARFRGTMITIGQPAPPSTTVIVQAAAPPLKRKQPRGNCPRCKKADLEKRNPPPLFILILCMTCVGILCIPLLMTKECPKCSVLKSLKSEIRNSHMNIKTSKNSTNCYVRTRVKVCPRRNF